MLSLVAADPLQYGMRALLINEFTAPRWQKAYPTDPSQNVGQALLYVFNFPLDYWWAYSVSNAASLFSCIGDTGSHELCCCFSCEQGYIRQLRSVRNLSWTCA